jgi:hypothetical protein
MRSCAKTGLLGLVKTSPPAMSNAGKNVMAVFLKDRNFISSSFR